jgi:hypothetical protein
MNTADRLGDAIEAIDRAAFQLSFVSWGMRTPADRDTWSLVMKARYASYRARLLLTRAMETIES